MLTYTGFDPSEARAWLRHSLSQGHSVALSAAASLDLDRGRVSCLLPSPMPDSIRFRAGGLGSFDVDADLAQAIDGAKARGARGLLIEDELARRGDPVTWANLLATSYIDEEVVHWLDLDTRAATEIRAAVGQASSGYPTNAFVLSSSAEDLGLRHGEGFPPSELGRIASAVDAIFVTAFDAESFVIWER